MKPSSLQLHMAHSLRHAYIIYQHMHAAYVRSDFFVAKSEKIFQNVVMAEQVHRFQLGFNFLKVEKNLQDRWLVNLMKKDLNY